MYSFIKGVFMKRKRIVVCNRDGVYHLMSRCCLGEHLLEDGEKEMFIGMMQRQAAFCGVDILAYSIMSNHFHILARVGTKNLKPMRSC